jgi:hypothetical protein
MGQAGLLRHYNAVHKHMMGWIPASEVQTLNSGTHTIALTAEENPVANGATELIYVPRGDGSQWAIERRASVGFDAGLSGVWVRIVDRRNTDDTELLGYNPLAAGQTLRDPAFDISITTLSDTGATASVQVCVGPCGGGGGSTTTSTSTTLPPGGSVVNVSVHLGRVVVTGTSRNDVIHLTGLPNGLRQVDANGAAMTVGHGCVLNGTVATCRGGPFIASLGDGDDEVFVTGAARSTLEGGNGDDWFVGGPRADRFMGGAGDDTVDYSGRPPGSVSVRVGGGPRSGARGEHDDIEADIEHVVIP